MIGGCQASIEEKRTTSSFRGKLKSKIYHFSVLGILYRICRYISSSISLKNNGKLESWNLVCHCWVSLVRAENRRQLLPLGYADRTWKSATAKNFNYVQVKRLVFVEASFLTLSKLLSILPWWKLVVSNLYLCGCTSIAGLLFSL